MLAVRGAKAEARRICTIVILAWLVLGFDLAYAKGQFDRMVTWVGHDVAIDPKRKSVTPTIK